MENDDREKVKNDGGEKMEEPQQQSAAQQPLQHQQRPSEQNIIIAEIAQQPDAGEDANATVNTSSALPTTVIMTQRHRMITTTGQIR